MSRFDWPGLMRLGLHELRLTPAQFWALSPAELRVMLGQGGPAQGPLSRNGLDALLAAYPDGARNAQKEQDDDGN
ncbi:MAG: phage tail assembly chaperone [Marinibacterium sp.]|nr:phage tail assembly chaperone [Marinibacterium sp.]